jgi:hypothetical protein
MALLRGSLETEDGFLIYKGKWGFNKEAHAAKDTSKFEMKSVSEAQFPGDADVDIMFEGFFVMKKDEEKKVKVKEESVKLSFSSDTEGSSVVVTGTGKNKFGDFSLTGRLDPASKKLQLEKVYIEEDGEFSGDSDGSGSDSDDDGSGMDEELNEDDIAEELADLKVG